MNFTKYYDNKFIASRELANMGIGIGYAGQAT